MSRPSLPFYVSSSPTTVIFITFCVVIICLYGLTDFLNSLSYRYNEHNTRMVSHIRHSQGLFDDVYLYQQLGISNATDCKMEKREKIDNI